MNPWEEYSESPPWEEYQNPVKSKQDPYKQVAKSDSVLDNTLAGIGGGMMSLYHGVKQAFGADNQDEVNQHRQAMEGLRTTAGGFAGDMLGQAAIAGPAMAIPGVNSYAGAAMLGGVMGGAQPTLEHESRALNVGVGALGGMGGKWAGDKVGKMLIGNPEGKLNQAQKIAQQKGKELGFKQTPGYATGSKGLQKLEAQMESNPFFSRPIEKIQEHNQTRMNQIAAKSLGETSDTLDSSVLGTVRTKVRDVYHKVATDTQRMLDPDKALDDLSLIADQYENMLPGDLLDQPLVAEYFKTAARGSASGRQLQHLSSRIGKKAEGQMTGAAGNRELGKALFDFKEIVDDNLGDTLTPQLKREFTDARKKYRTLMQLTKRNNVVNPSDGNVHPIALSNYLQQKDKTGFLYGGNQSDLYNAARFGQAFKPIVGNSGTATRSGSGKDILTNLLAPLSNFAAQSYTTPPVGGLANAYSRYGLMNLPEEALEHMNRLGLMTGATAGSQAQSR